MEMISKNYNENNVKKESEIRELYLYAVNTQVLYTRFYCGIQKNLFKKFLKNEYDPQLAQKSILNTLNDVQKSYIKEFCNHDFKFNLNTDEKRFLANDILLHYVGDFMENKKNNITC